MPQIGPYSRTAILSKLDGRTREARLMRGTRAALIAHVGGKPSVVQQTLIERACQLQIRIAMMDRDFSTGGVQTEHDSRTYLAWSNSLTRTLKALGLAAADTDRSHEEAFAALHARYGRSQGTEGEAGEEAA
jgi:hypothetical protein